MTGVALLLVYEPAGGRPLEVARVRDAHLVLAAANSAILQAEERAAELAQADSLLGAIERSEAFRLRRVLKLLVPGVADEPDWSLPGKLQ